MTDASGAVVQNTTVTLVNKQTGSRLSTQSSSSGSYTFPNVLVGEYSLSAEATNFAITTAAVSIALNQTVTANITLQASGIQATVTVDGSSVALVQTDTSQLGQTFETRQVTDLPIFGNHLSSFSVRRQI